MCSVFTTVLYVVILIISFGIHRNSQLGLWLTWTPYSLILSVNRKSLYFAVWSFITDFLGKRRLVGVFADRGGVPTKVLRCSKFQSFAFNFPEICPLLGSPQWREHLHLGDIAGQKEGSGLRFPSFLWSSDLVCAWVGEVCLCVSVCERAYACGSISPFLSSKTHWCTQSFSFTCSSVISVWTIADMLNPGYWVWLELI